MLKSRIAILDSFRAIAILAVMFFHFYYRWAPPLYKVSLYPDKISLNYFKYGYLGVEFFFIISGFAIFFTLDNTPGIKTFWKKRLIRLTPSIVVASLITYIAFCFFDYSNIFPYSHHAANLIPSITFINPDLLNNIFISMNISLAYINGSYWSLWPELQFYFLSSIIFYYNKEKFIRNFIMISLFMIAFHYLMQNIQGNNKLHIFLPASFLKAYFKWVQHGFNLVTYLPFFCIGVLFYSLFKNHNSKCKTSSDIKLYLALFIFFIIYTGVLYQVKLIYLGMIFLFICFIYFRDKLAFLENKQLTKIGESSYFLYLIHENIGILIIFYLGNYFLSYGFIFTFLVIISLIILSNLFTAKFDMPINNWLKKRII